MTYNDLFYTLEALGYSGGLSDKIFAYLVDQGYKAGFNDMLFAFLGDQGYTGLSLTDKVAAWALDDYALPEEEEE